MGPALGHRFSIEDWFPAAEQQKMPPVPEAGRGLFRFLFFIGGFIFIF